MRQRQANYRRVKIHRSYKIEEIALLLSVHKNTVRAWVKAGLPACDRNRPTLIVGRELRVFLQSRRANRKQPCRPGELFCFRCRAPKKPAGKMVDCEPVTEKIGNLTALCPDCECIMNQRISMAKLRSLQVEMEIKFPLALGRMGESYQPSVNSDLEQETRR
jgi:hypothetical protein